MVSSTAAHASSFLICGSATGWFRWWFSRWQASLCQYWTYAPLSSYAALFEGLSFRWEKRVMWWPITVVLDPMAVNFCMGGNINSWALGSFSLEEYFLLKLSFPILMLVCNLALPGGFFPHDTKLQALVGRWFLWIQGTGNCVCILSHKERKHSRTDVNPCYWEDSLTLCPKVQQPRGVWD